MRTGLFQHQDLAPPSLLPAKPKRCGSGGQILDKFPGHIDDYAAAFAKLTPDEQIDLYPYLDPIWRLGIADPNTKLHLRKVYVDSYRIPGRSFRSEQEPGLKDMFMKFVDGLEEAKPEVKQYMLSRLAHTTTFKDIIPSEEYLALRIYMGGPHAFAYKKRALFAVMNAAMRTLGDRNEDPKDRLQAWRTLESLEPFVKVFTSACNRAPRYSGIVNRGIRIKRADGRKEFVVGESALRSAFTSTSKTEEGAMGEEAGRNLKFKMHVDDAADLSEANQTQEEVMVMPGTDFNVEDLTEDVLLAPDAELEVINVEVDESDPDEEYPPITVTLRQKPSPEKLTPPALS